MATQDIYALAEKDSTRYMYLIYSNDGGSTWSEIAGPLAATRNIWWQLRAPSTSFRNQGDYIYFACSNSNSNTGYAGYIGRHEHGTTNTDYVDVKDLLGYGLNWGINPIAPLDENNIYFTISNYGTNVCYLYHFNGNWASPQASDFTIITTISSYHEFYYAADILPLATDDIYIATKGAGTYTAGGYSYVYPSIVHWDGTSKTYPSENHLFSSNYSRYTYGVKQYNGNIYVVASGDGGTSGSHIMIYKGDIANGFDVYGQFDDLSDWFTNEAQYAPWGLNVFIDPQTGDIYFNFGGRATPGSGMGYGTYLWKYDGSNFSQHHIFNTNKFGQASVAYTVYAVSTDQVLCGTGERSSLYTMDMSDDSITSINPSGYGVVYNALLFDSSPYLNSSPTGKNNYYFTTVPLVWSIGD